MHILNLSWHSVQGLINSFLRVELLLRIKCGNLTLPVGGTSVRKRCVNAQTMRNAKHIHASAHRCFSGLVGPPKEDAPAESDRTQHDADKPAHNLTGTPPLCLCNFGVCVCESVVTFDILYGRFISTDSACLWNKFILRIIFNTLLLW